MFKQPLFILFAATVILSGCGSFSQLDSLNYSGRVLTGNGEPVASVVVTNGFDVVSTDSEGRYRLYKRSSVKFISISVPSGYRADPWYINPDGTDRSYDFSLIPHGPASEEAVSFIHLTDTETSSAGEWIQNVKNYAANHKSDFVIHTGDICYEEGMEFHAQEVNSETLGLPVYYGIGNHDLVKGKSGESFYEERFGPVYYSFNAGGVHFVVTPMLHGDYRPSYSKAQVARWLEQDLSLIPKGTPVVVFNHDLYTWDEEFTYNQIDLREHNLKGWAYGHWHINFIKEHGSSGVLSWTTAPPKGGIDHSAGNFPVVTISPEGEIRLENRYPFFNSHLSLPAPGIARIYDSSTDAKSVVYKRYREGMPVGSSQMRRVDAFTWVAAQNEGDFDSATVEVTFTDGRKISKQAESFSPELRLLNRTGGESFLTPPLLAEGKLFAATQDDTGHRRHAVSAYNRRTGEKLWTTPTRQSVRNTMVYHEGRIGLSDAAGNLYILSAGDGKELHFIPSDMKGLGQNMSGCALDNGILFGGFGSSLKAVNMKNGEVIWRNRDWHGGEGTTSNIVIHKDLLITGSNWRALYAHDKKSGRLIWKATDNSIRYQSSTPIIVENRIVNINGSRINSLSPEGHFLSSHETTLGFQVSGSPVSAAISGRDLFFVPTSHSGISALLQSDGSEIWNYRTGEALIYTSPYSSRGEKPVSTVEGTPLLIDGRLYFGASDGFIHCVDASSGSLIQKWEAGMPILASLSADSGYLYAVDFAGGIWELSIH